MDKRQEWMVEKLVALEEFARLSNWMEVANLLRIASRAALGDLKHVCIKLSKAYQIYEDYWFENALDQLTRHAHEFDMPEVEKHLENARAAWDFQANNGSANSTIPQYTQ